MLEFGNILGYIIGAIGTTATITATIIIYITGKKVNVEACGLMMSKLEDKIGVISDNESKGFTQISGDDLERRVVGAEKDIKDIRVELRDNQKVIIKMLAQQETILETLKNK